MADKIFTDGMWFNRNDNAPEFVLGQISIDVYRFTEFLKRNVKDGKVKIDVLKSKNTGKPYCVLSTFESKRKESNPFDQTDPSDDAPF